MTRPLRVLLVAAGLAVIAILIVRTGPAILLEMLRRVGWSAITVIVLYALHVALRAVALWRVVVGPQVRFSDVLRVRLSGEAVEGLTYTGPFLAEPAKGWLLTRRGLSTTDAFAAVVTEYLLYTTMSAALALVSFSLLIEDGMVPGLFRGAAIVIVGAMAAFIGAVLFASLSGVGLIEPIVRRIGRPFGRERIARVTGIIAPVERVLVAFLHEHPARLLEVLAIEALGHGLLVAEIWVVLSAIGVPFLARDPLIVEGGGKLVSTVFFFIPGQLGAAEAVYASLLRTVGLSASAGLTLAIVRRIRSLVVAFVGLLVVGWFDDPSRR